MSELLFKCPKCGCETLEEIMVNCVITSDMLEFLNCDADPTANYGETNIVTGDVDRYQCSECGYVITDYNGENVVDIHNIVKWIKKENLRLKKD